MLSSICCAFAFLSFTLVNAESVMDINPFDITVGKSLCQSALTEDQAWEAGQAFGWALLDVWEMLDKEPFIIAVQESKSCGEGVYGYDVQVALIVPVEDENSRDLVIDLVVAAIEDPKFNKQFGDRLRQMTGFEVDVWDIEQVSCRSLEAQGHLLCPAKDSLEFNSDVRKTVTCKGQECQLACCRPLNPCRDQDELSCADEVRKDSCWFNEGAQECVQFEEKCWQIKDHSKCAAAPGCDWHTEFDRCNTEAGDGVPCRAIEDEFVCDNFTNGWCEWDRWKCGQSSHRDKIYCSAVDLESREACDAIEDGVCMWDVSIKECVKHKENGIKCDSVKSQAACNQMTYGNCVWSDKDCRAVGEKVKCDEWNVQINCKQEDKCQWNKLIEACTRINGDGVTCAALDNETDCVRQSGGYCEWFQATRTCETIVDDWEEICAEFESRSKCNKERLGRCVWNTLEPGCEPVDINGIRCEWINKQKSCTERAGGKCKWSSEGCVQSEDEVSVVCSDLGNKSACMAPGGCLWDWKASKCNNNVIVDSCAKMVSTRACLKSEECLWDDEYELCFSKSAECPSMTYFSCLSAINCSWQGEQDGECVGATLAEMNEICGYATWDDDCTNMGCKWVSKPVPGGRRGRKQKKASGTCVAPDGEGAEEVVEAAYADSCIGYEHHQTLAAQIEHCAASKNNKRCEGRGCEHSAAGCFPSENPSCAKTVLASCCRIPGCTIDENDKCSGTFAGWRD